MGRESLVKNALVQGLPSIRPIGKLYDHLMICSGDRRKPIGHYGCCCLRIFRNIEDKSTY
jgi:hypothetical protein